MRLGVVAVMGYDDNLIPYSKTVHRIFVRSHLAWPKTEFLRDYWQKQPDTVFNDGFMRSSDGIFWNIAGNPHVYAVEGKARL